ncbi:hypothetical protein COMA2_200014 [Candidatus Nitrospira nitrificans]|uniref:Uncharacterized protein n=1 Tax=Candidatus Nitrospira nitrificans TaxID=1742973 RepID=A0A0S4LJ90_9BACT|nr:hypothetical protein COMA2_200014 [Candidatus Nitrospira nitrificans]
MAKRVLVVLVSGVGFQLVNTSHPPELKPKIDPQRGPTPNHGYFSNSRQSSVIDQANPTRDRMSDCMTVSIHGPWPRLPIPPRPIVRASLEWKIGLTVSSESCSN